MVAPRACCAGGSPVLRFHRPVGPGGPAENSSLSPASPLKARAGCAACFGPDGRAPRSAEPSGALQPAKEAMLLLRARSGSWGAAVTSPQALHEPQTSESLRSSALRTMKAAVKDTVECLDPREGRWCQAPAVQKATSAASKRYARYA